MNKTNIMNINILKNKSLLVYLMICSIIIKCILLLIMGPHTFLDGKAYITIAEFIFNNNFSFPSSELDDMPITPYIYSIFYPISKYIGLYAYAIPNIILASITILIIFHITLLIFENKVIANISAIITAFYPFFNFYSITILTEIIFIFFLYLSLFYATRFMKYLSLKDLLLFSLLFAMSSLVRPITIPMFAFFLILFIIYLIQKNRKIYTIVKYITSSIIVFYMTLSPWIIRNYQITNEIRLTTPSPNASFAFYIGNNPLNKTGGGLNGDFDLSKYENMSDINKASEIAFKDSINWIINNPTDWALLVYKKFIRFYRITIHAKQYQSIKYKLLSIFSYGIIVLLFSYGLIASYRSYFWVYSPMILFTLLLTGIHMTLFASVRYRLPIEPFMIIIGSYAIYNLFKKVKQKQ